MLRPTKRLPRPSELSALKLLLVVGYLAWDHQAVSGRVASLGISPALAAYVALYALLAAALAAAAFIPRHDVRVGFATLLAAGSILLHGYEWTTGAPLTYDGFETMLASSGAADEAAGQHAGMLLQALAAAAVLFAGLALPPRRHGLPFGLGWLLPTGAVLALSGLLYVRGGEGTRALPAPFSPLAEGALMAALELADDDAPRRPVTLVPGEPLVSGDVVLVIDESVAANYLDINHPDGVRSGLADERPGVAIASFGVAAAASNCSAGSNRTLRFGGTRANYRETARRAPSIWAYAGAAGYRTVYIDGQRGGGRLHNLMDDEERAEIDDFVQLGATPVAARDHRIADLVGERVANAVPELILVNMVGAHFPVDDKFPEAAAVFGPLPARGRGAGIIAAAHPDARSGEAAEWRLYRNAYRNTVQWSTGGFFDRLLPRAANSGAVIVYTSDHGQDLHERDDGGRATHCVPEPRAEEGAVPLVVIDAAGGALDWQAAAAAHFDGTSHFRVFPTLLALMGYAPRDTAAAYGPTLVDRGGDPMTFTPTFFATLGREPTWVEVERGRLAGPPRSDFATLARR